MRHMRHKQSLLSVVDLKRQRGPAYGFGGWKSCCIVTFDISNATESAKAERTGRERARAYVSGHVSYRLSEQVAFSRMGSADLCSARCDDGPYREGNLGSAASSRSMGAGRGRT